MASLLYRVTSTSRFVHVSYFAKPWTRSRSCRVHHLATMAHTQQAVYVDETNREGDRKGKVQYTRSKEVPTPSEREVLVRLTLRPINPADIASLGFAYPGFRPTAFPATPGLEGVGVVEQNGPGASKFKEGTRVVAASWGTVNGQGTWQQKVVVPEANLLAVPAAVADEVAAQFIVNPVTVYGFLDTLQVPAGAWILQSAAGSVLGHQLIALAKHKGIKTINLVRRPEAQQDILDAGGDTVICTSEVEDVAKRVKEITNGEMAYGAVDPVAGALTGKIAASVRPGGTVLVFGGLGGLYVDGLSLRDLLFRGVIVTGFWLNRYLGALGARKGEVLSEVLQLLAEGVIRPRAGKRFPLEQANEAIAESLKEARGGKVLLEG